MIHSEEQVKAFRKFMGEYKDNGESDFEVYNRFVRTTEIRTHDFETALWYLRKIAMMRGAVR